MYKIICGLVLLIFLGSCQNRNQVTHNKRKYRKGYYQPNRTKVKHRKSREEETYAYHSKTNDKKQAKTESSKKQNISKSRKSEELVENHDKEQSENKRIDRSNGGIDAIPSSENEKTQKKREPTIQIPEDEPDSDKPERKKVNWIFWVSLLCFIFFSLGIFWLIFALEVAIIIISILMAIALALIVLNIWNVAQHEKNETNKTIRGASIVMVSLLFVFLFMASIFLIIIAFL